MVMIRFCNQCVLWNDVDLRQMLDVDWKKSPKRTVCLPTLSVRCFHIVV